MSVAAETMTDDDLRSMPREARLRNEALGVSGLLVAKEGRFMQVLEGPRWSVEDRYNVIRNDPRHLDVRSVSIETITGRRFTEWSMAFGNPANTDLATEPGLSDFLAHHGALPAGLRGTPADWLLRWFRARTLTSVTEEPTSLNRAAT